MPFLGQPPCEAVSWNFLVILKLNWDIRQPPCEAVSWNGLKSQMAQSVFVSLLVRLWVEIVFVLRMAYVAFVSLLVRLWVEIFWQHLKAIRFQSILSTRLVSWNILAALKGKQLRSSASLWGCELKSLYKGKTAQLKMRQPPCEAVSWNALDKLHNQTGTKSASLWGCELKYRCLGYWLELITVSLLVRLWVEILSLPCAPIVWPSASLWGCELKYERYYNSITGKKVSLLVRLWVEIHLKVLYMVIQLSASLWGCELKYILGCVAGYVIIGQPPCEAVSWNVHHGRTQNKHVCQPPCEAVSWNIKNITHLLPWPLSASLWGCELKYL